MHPVVAALKHHKTAVVLVALEIALTCAIVTNALSVIGRRVTAMNVTTGVANNELVWATTAMFQLGPKVAAKRKSGSELIAADLAALRAIPGVRSVAITNSLPLNGVTSRYPAFRRLGGRYGSLEVDVYLGTPGIVKTLGVGLARGRYFLPQEFVNWGQSSPAPPAAIITRKLAEQLWPGQNPLGKPIYLNKSGNQVTHVVGVVKDLLDPSIHPDQGAQNNVILPVKAAVIGNQMYVLRVKPNRRMVIKRAIPEVLHRVDPARRVDAHIYANTLSSYFHGDRAMVWVLIAVIACLLAITALGLVGLSSFWVQQRTRSIGIRRALGATRGSILNYFQIENFLIVTLGVAVGVILAVILNLFLLQHYPLQRMPPWYLLVGAIVLWLLGQLAVLATILFRYAISVEVRAFGGVKRHGA